MYFLRKKNSCIQCVDYQYIPAHYKELAHHKQDQGRTNQLALYVFKDVKNMNQ